MIIGILVPIVAIGLLIFIFGEKVEMVKEIKEQNLSILRVPHEGYSRNTSCALNNMII
jgi:hypothetical protein